MADSAPPIKVVYDVDDVLWGLNQRVVDQLGISMSRNVEYRISKCPLYTNAEKSAVLRAFQEVETFKQIDFFAGAQEILNAESYGATIRIHSNCFTAAIAEEKRRQLAALLPAMKASFIKFSLIGSDASRKQIDGDAYIFVDDSPYNIAASIAKFNLVPRWPWNTTDEARATMTADGKLIADPYPDFGQLIKSRKRYIIYCKDLKEINRFVIEIVKAKQEAKHVKK